IQSDLGTNFRSALMTQLFRMCGIKQKFSSVSHPETNAMLERLHRVLKNSLRSVLAKDKSLEWDQHLPHIMYCIRDSVNASTGFTPAELMFGRGFRSPLALIREAWTASPEESQNILEFVTKQLNSMQAAREVAEKNQSDAADDRKFYY